MEEKREHLNLETYHTFRLIRPALALRRAVSTYFLENRESVQGCIFPFLGQNHALEVRARITKISYPTAEVPTTFNPDYLVEWLEVTVLIRISDRKN